MGELFLNNLTKQNSNINNYFIKKETNFKLNFYNILYLILMFVCVLKLKKYMCILNLSNYMVKIANTILLKNLTT